MKRVIAALVALCMALPLVSCGGGAAVAPSPTVARKELEVVSAKYPEAVPYPIIADFEDELTHETDFDGYNEAYKSYLEYSAGCDSLRESYSDCFDGFFENLMPALLSGSEGENRVCSPLNIYLAMSALAELCGGGSREELLAALCAESLDELRGDASARLRVCYRDDGAVTSIPAASLWMSDSLSYRREPVLQLSELYCASTYSVPMGSDETAAVFGQWLNAQTGGLLKEQAGGVSFDPETVLALATTVYYRAKWEHRFSEENTAEGVFHSPDGDISCRMMATIRDTSYYWGDSYSAVGLELAGSGRMWLILPDEGVSADALLNDASVTELILRGGRQSESRELRVHLKLPRFDVTSDLDLSGTMVAMGLGGLFDKNVADFSPLLEDADGICLSSACHAARVVADEEGCHAAAYAVVVAAGDAVSPELDEIDLVLDRPFLFVITGADDTPLFAGIVNCPQ